MEETNLEIVSQYIITIRNQRVMIDADLARLYGVSTKALNQAIKRNIGRFPQDFMFRLTSDEKNELVTNCDQFKNIKHSISLPYAFTEHGAIMVASVLNVPKAIEISVYIVRAFVKMREMLSANRNFLQKLLTLENRVTDHDNSIKMIFDVLRKMLTPPQITKRKIGF